MAPAGRRFSGQLDRGASLVSPTEPGSSLSRSAERAILGPLWCVTLGNTREKKLFEPDLRNSQSERPQSGLF